MIDKYILKGKTPVPATLQEWASWFETAERHVARSEKDGVQVSTVFMGLNHQWGEGPPLIFETMIFGGEHDQEQWRCSTWDQAEVQHVLACELAGIPYVRPSGDVRPNE